MVGSGGVPPDGDDPPAGAWLSRRPEASNRPAARAAWAPEWVAVSSVRPAGWWSGRAVVSSARPTGWWSGRAVVWWARPDGVVRRVGRWCRRCVPGGRRARVGRRCGGRGGRRRCSGPAARARRRGGVVLGSGGVVPVSGVVEVSTGSFVPATMCVGRCRRRRGVEDEVDPVVVPAALREALGLDRPGRHDLRRPERRIERGELVGQVARVDVRLRHPLAVDREDVERVAARPVTHLERADPELVLLRQVVEHRDEPRVGAAPRERCMRLRREGQVRVVEQGRDVRRAREMLASSPTPRGGP